MASVESDEDIDTILLEIAESAALIAKSAAYVAGSPALRAEFAALRAKRAELISERDELLRKISIQEQVGIPNMI